MQKGVLPMCAAVLAGFTTVNAQACSMSSSPEAIRDAIKARQDVRQVKGQFTVTTEPIAATEYGKPVTFLGTLKSKHETAWEVWLHYHEVFVQCGIQFAPAVDAAGTFWISRRKIDGRHEILLWEGEYLLPQTQSEESDS